jgi:predicted DNA-binding transcriptional regulator AlpA
MSTEQTLITVADFCARHSISKSYFYVLRKKGAAPPSMMLGRKRLISATAAEQWRRNLMERPER